ncbi:DoxX family protein [Paenibacillus mendelii]|uniref:DoxX family protein n=1 Tax=Paenibacillus mendelii TaxID=206163 RepID=A0ABV6J329_9BACL|nr:DoxX family protein [Paenibacillus mendelii]MCQ6559393.1 DoxX family protein [Paenibacillus mendelii]
MNIVTIILQSLLLLAFLFSGLSKIAGAKMQVEVFRHIKLPQWFRVFTGFVQVAGAAGLLAGFWDKGMLSLAALWIGCTMLGAVLSHIRVNDPIKQMFAPFLLMILSMTLALLHLSELKALF